jgi:CRP/FNR family transcriptional regulator, cyclic AMP receptor protein
MLSNIYHATCQEVRYLGLSGSAAEKLARFLLDLKPKNSRTGQDRTTLTLTHEQIAEMIGASRETVTRLLAGFKRKRIIELHGSALVIKDRDELRRVVEGEPRASAAG